MTIHILSFGTPGCAACKAIRTVVAATTTECGFGLVELDANVEHRLVRLYGISGLPTLVVLRNGQHAANICGPDATKERVAESIRQYREG
jgi:thioredoxin-like negative regulator of GroEL